MRESPLNALHAGKVISGRSESTADNLRAIRPPKIGVWARDVYRAMCLSPKGALDPASKLGQRVLIPLFYLIRIGFFTVRDSISVWRQRRISLLRQLSAQWQLAVRHRIDPSVYYSSQLYDLPLGVHEAGDYLGRDEIKNGLMKELHHLQPKIFGRRVSLGSKLIFSRHCEAKGLPFPSIICVVNRGHWAFGSGVHATTDRQDQEEKDFRCLDRDIFIKPVHGRGARGAEWFDWLGNDRYRSKKGKELSRAEVLRHITAKSSREAILVLPKLTNHRDIADLARDSLMVFRVFTCLDGAGQPHVTHCMLRILAKLEPSWSEHVEYGVAVDLTTGQLGQLCDDFHFAPDAWWDRHPRTNAPVRWRKIKQWPAIQELAKQAHLAFIDRSIIGWDIALTNDGPMLIEGNAYPDTHFLQRVHRQLIGRSPMAPLLAQQLTRLTEKKARPVADHAA